MSLSLSATLDRLRAVNDATDAAPPPVRHTALVVWLERALVVWLLLLAFTTPLSIAVSQGIWTAALLTWGLRACLRPRLHWRRTPLDWLWLAFVGWTILSSFTSFDVPVSVGKLRAVSLFTIVFLVAQNVHSKRLLRALLIALLAGVMLSVAWTFVERAIGRGVKIEGLQSASPLLANAPLDAATQQNASATGANPAQYILSGDTLLEVDGRKLHNADELVAALSENKPAPARIKIYRYEWTPVFEVPRGTLLPGATAAEKLGITAWHKGRDWRAAGFYGHYTTYAEVLQLVMSLALGLLLATTARQKSWRALLLLALVGMAAALILSVTRASALAFLVATGVIILAGASRRTALILILCAAPLVLAGLFMLQQKRNVKFFDSKDGSTTWRTTVWREGFARLTSSPRNLIVGVGMDSLKTHYLEWGMFDHGKLPVGHLHSTPLQLAFERGVPALLLWLALLAVYLRMLWRTFRAGTSEDDWIERGLMLGALGGTIGFCTSGLVHYNLGDSEVAMVFYLTMGLSLAVYLRGLTMQQEKTQRAGKLK